MKTRSLGTISYQEALTLQLKLVEGVIAKTEEETILICNHPPIVTLGKQTKEEDLIGWSGEILHVSRGGRATYHGPSQLILYPIIDLSKHHKDIRAYVRSLETSVIETLAHFRIEASSDVDNTGVWISDRKIASIGVAVKRWITYHGVAINLEYDKEAFQGIRPCGLSPQTMVSVEEILSAKISAKEFEFELVSMLRKKLDSIQIL